MLSHPLLHPGKKLRELMQAKTVVMPGVYDAVTAIAAHKAGFEAAYMSGAAVTNSQLGVPDIGMITLTEMASQAARICQVAPIPILSDADTGFGETWNVARTVIEMERAGLAGIHLEDQVMPKKCGHLDGKGLITAHEMSQKIRAAVDAKRDADFLVMARTDARGVDGIEVAIERAKAYVDAGADAIFPEGLEAIDEFAKFRKSVDVPLLANMTEFGKTPIISVSEFADLGYNLVIYPVSALRIALKAVTDFYRSLNENGTQTALISSMFTRKELYGLIDYPDFEARDAAWTTSRKADIS